MMARCKCRKLVIVAVVPCVLIIISYVILLFSSNLLMGGLNVDNGLLYSAVTHDGEATFYLERNLRLVSYNLWCEYLKPHTVWNINERIDGLAEGIKDFDIALIQEAYVFNTGIATISSCASLLVKAMTKRGFDYRTSLADFHAPHFGQSGGIIIFSRVPLVRTQSTQFRNFSIYQIADFRGFVVGEYVVNSKHLYVVNTHLDPHEVKARILQVNELTSAIKKIAVASHIIVSGDFNIDNHYPTTSNGSKEYITLLQTMSQAGLRSVFPLRMETNIDGGNYDAMFTSSNIAVVRKEIIKLVTASKELVSDHFGLAVELKLL